MNLKSPTLLITLIILAGCGEGRKQEIAVGTLERNRIELSAEVREPVAEIFVAEGDVVTAGDILVSLNSDRATLRAAMATADREASAARLAELESGPRFEKLTSARAALTGAEEVFREARRTKNRTDKLVAQGTLPQARREQATALMAQAEAARDTAAAQLDELEHGTRSEILDQARAQLQKAELLLEEASLTLERHKIVAPVGATVEALPFELGERPQVGQPLAVLLEGGRPYARVYVPEAIKANFVKGQKIEVKVEGRDETYEGQMRYLGSDASFTPFFALTEHDRGKFTYLAEIDLVGEEAETLPTGLPVEVRFRSAE